MLYYLKKCGFQELGSVGSDGRPRRGRYLLTSKKVLEFFPPLSTTEKNDRALLAVLPLYTGKKVYCHFVYHNDKYHDSQALHPRDEYRIYINRALEEDGHTFAKGDILVFSREERPLEDGETETVYYLQHLSERESAFYQECDRWIRESSVNGGYALADTEFPLFEQAKALRMGTAAPEEVSIDPRVTEAIEASALDDGRIAGLFNAASFRDFVMTGYENRCAVTDSAIRYGSFTNLEAAHIRPKSHRGLYIPSNGIALTRDFHWAFDKGFFTVDDHFQVRVHERVESAYLKSFDKKRIFVPPDSFFAPKKEYLQYHQEHIYGLFLTSGRIGQERAVTYDECD